MKTLLTVILTLLIAGSAFAQLPNSMGVFFSDADLSEANTNANPTANVPFDAYIALLNTEVITVGGYECGLTAPGTLLALAADGPNGWTNFGGSNWNHLCGFMVPVPAYQTGDAVLGHLQLMYLSTDAANIVMGPATPSSFNNEGPGIADGANPDWLILCPYTSGPDWPILGEVATLHGAGITFPESVATQNQSWTGVKALFN
jgi:hypothetical protein